jgi:hypothetical protein
MYQPYMPDIPQELAPNSDQSPVIFPPFSFYKFQNITLQLKFNVDYSLEELDQSYSDWYFS